MAVERPTVAAFRARFDEFAETSDDDIDAMIDVGYEIYATSTNALMYLIAHLLTIDASSSSSRQDGGSGEVRAESIGERSLEYMPQARNAGEVFYTTTHYGRMHVQLRRASPSRLAPRVIG